MPIRFVRINRSVTFSGVVSAKFIDATPAALIIALATWCLLLIFFVTDLISSYEVMSHGSSQNLGLSSRERPMTSSPLASNLLQI